MAHETEPATIDRPDVSIERKNALVRLFTRIGQVSTLPESALKIVRLAGEDSTTTDLLTEVIGTDPMLASQVLQQVNSTRYGLRNRVSDLKTAIGLLGFREMKSIALTLYISSLYEKSEDYKDYSRQGLWGHSIAVANVSRSISIICQRGEADEVYVTGLLHDLGMILLEQTLKHHFHQVLDELEPERPTEDVENAILTFSHADLGAYVVEQWNFPQRIVAGLKYHHHPEQYQGAHCDYVDIVAIANHIVTAEGISSTGVQNVPKPVQEVYYRLGLDETNVQILMDELPELLEMSQHFKENQ